MRWSALVLEQGQASYAVAQKMYSVPGCRSSGLGDRMGEYKKNGELHIARADTQEMKLEQQSMLC